MRRGPAGLLVAFIALGGLSPARAINEETCSVSVCAHADITSTGQWCEGVPGGLRCRPDLTFSASARSGLPDPGLPGGLLAGFTLKACVWSTDIPPATGSCLRDPIHAAGEAAWAWPFQQRTASLVDVIEAEAFTVPVYGMICLRITMFGEATARGYSGDRSVPLDQATHAIVVGRGLMLCLN